MPSQSPESLITELLSKCEQAVSSGNFEEAITGCRAILQVTPDHSRAKQLLDEAQSKMEAHLFVRDNLRKAQEFFNNREYQKCLSECQKILLLDSNNSAVTTLMKKAQEKMEAEPFVQNFITSGQSLFDSGLYNEAISQWEKVRSIDPAYPGLDALIQNARQKLGENEELTDTIAADSMPSLDLNLDINTEQGPDGFSFDAFGIEQPEEKTEALTFKSDEDRIQYLLREGDELSGSGHYQRAIEVWSEIFMLDVNHPEALQKIEVARQASAQQRQASQEIVKKAIAAYEKGEVEEARDLFQQVQASDPDNAEALRYLEMLPSPTSGGPASLNDLVAQAKQAENEGQYREAAMLYSQALAIDADNAELADRVKDLNLMAKRQEQGRTVLGNARAFLAEGKLESARHAVTKILEADPSNPEALEIMKEIKAHAGGASASADGRIAPASTAVTRHAKKSLPLMPMMLVGGALVLLGSGFLLWNSLGSKSEDVAQVRPIQKPIKKPTTKQPTPVSTKPAVMVSPQDKQKAGELVQEAQFYFMEKRYDEALQKAEDALKLDPENKDGAGIRDESSRLIKEAQTAEQKILDDANAYFSYSEFAGAVKLYEKYLQRHPETVQHIQPQIIKCYYNLGVIAIRQWRCDTAADYFRQVLFIDETDKLSKDALDLSRKCQKMGTSDLDVRKAVAFMEMRK
jgi:tetratricopeptide (TPR) repeat protein